MPLFSLVPEGVFLEATTGASDPLGIHGYSVDINYDSVSQKTGGAVGYAHTRGATVFSLSTFYQPVYYYTLGLAATSYGANASASFPLSTKTQNWRGIFRWSYDSTELPGIPTYTQGGPAVGLRYDNTSQKPTAISPETGGIVYLEQQQFLAGLGNLEYGRTRANGTYYFSKWLPSHHVLMARTNSSWSPANRSVLLGTSAGGDYSFTFIDPQFTVRGYPIGEFLGWSLATATLEYRFPLYKVYSGWNTKPIFLKRWHGAIFSDAIALDGGFYDRTARTYLRTQLGRIFYSAGAEVRSDITLAYHVPATFRIGLFYGFNDEAFGGVYPFVGLTIPKF
jgi:hypothetical protein